MRTSTPRIGRCLLLLTLALAAWALGACSDDEGGGGGDGDGSAVTVGPDDSTSTTPATEATTTTANPADAVEAAFFAQWDAFVEIASTPDPSNPQIDDYFTGPAKEALLDGLSTLIDRGHAIRLPTDPSRFEPRIVETRVESATRAVVFECTREGLVIVDSSSGAVVNDGISEFESRTEFQLVSGEWLVRDTRDVEEGEPGCDAL